MEGREPILRLMIGPCLAWRVLRKGSSSEPLDACDNGDVWWAMREGYGGCEGGDNGFDEEDDRKSNEDDEPCFHYVKVLFK